MSPSFSRIPLTTHAIRILATVAVLAVFRWRRLTRLRLFRAAMGAIFGRLAPRYEALWGRLPGGWETLEAPLRQALGDHLIGPAPRRVLDMCCGTARASRLLLERFPATTPVALDISPAMLEQASVLWAGRRPDLACVAGDAASPPFAPGSFDMVVVMNAPPEPEAVIELLAPRGRAIFAYSLPYTPMVRPSVRRRLALAGFNLTAVRPSGLGVLIIAQRDEIP
ncbi:MAG: class I SAM-dependent methyltransferase [Nitrospinae bacterium]|nr:class I SAM-dependent methyltransferase [Nitrospinota bacterium]